MADRVFIQKSRIGLKIFQLKDDAITISAKWTGKNECTEFSLKSISGEYQRVARRFNALIVVPLALCVFSLWICSELLTRDRMPIAPVGYPIGFAIFFLVLTIRGVPRIDVFQFFNHWDKPIFYVVRERHQASECDAFVRELLHRIDCVQNGQAAVADGSADDDCADELPDANSLGPLWSGEYRWKASIIFGAFSAGIPWIGAFFDLFQELPFPLVFIGTVVGIAFCVLSYQAKERLRHISLLGAALSMIAPLFY